MQMKPMYTDVGRHIVLQNVGELANGLNRCVPGLGSVVVLPHHLSGIASMFLLLPVVSSSNRWPIVLCQSAYQLETSCINQNCTLVVHSLLVVSEVDTCGVYVLFSRGASAVGV